MGTFYSTANIFAHQPLRVFAVAGLFLLLAVAVRRMKPRAPDLTSAPFVAGAVLWGLFGLNEFFWYTQLSTVPIRVDLFITWPVLVALTALCLIGGLVMSIHAFDQESGDQDEALGINEASDGVE